MGFVRYKFAATRNTDFFSKRPRMELNIMQGLSKEQSDIIEKLIAGGATCKTFPTPNTQYDMPDASQHRLCDINSGKPCIFGMILSDYDANDMCFEIMIRNCFC